MKGMVIVGALALALTCPGVRVAGQGILSSNPLPMLQYRAGVSPAQIGTAKQARRPPYSPESLAPRPSARREPLAARHELRGGGSLERRYSAASQPGLPKTPNTLAPSVYRTVPYTCIVVVPGPRLDDRAIVNPGRAEASMPIIKPDLQFIPYAPKP